MKAVKGGGMSSLQWEVIESAEHTGGNSHKSIVTTRLRVPGGWLVKTVIWKRITKTVAESDDEFAVALAFVPDPAGTWKP